MNVNILTQKTLELLRTTLFVSNQHHTIYND